MKQTWAATRVSHGNVTRGDTSQLTKHPSLEFHLHKMARTVTADSDKVFWTGGRNVLKLVLAMAAPL